MPKLPRYETLELLGHGGMGVVYKARDLQLSRLVALKMIRDNSLADPGDIARFQAEAETVARLNHPNIIQIFDVGNHEGTHYLALEYAEGGSLDKKLNGKPRSPKQSAESVQTLAAAVHQAHLNGVVHRDLKPANVLVSKGWVLKISDFGLARNIGASIHSGSNHLVGTPNYMAPEQATGIGKAVGPATDIYALGAILYELLTGRPPFVGVSTLDTLYQVVHDNPVPPRAMHGNIPPDLETICLKCLRKDPVSRYESAKHFADDLERFRLGKPIQARPVGKTEKLVLWARRKPAVAALMGALATVLLLASITTTVLWLIASARAESAANEASAKEQQRLRAEKNAEEAKAHAAAKEVEWARAEKNAADAKRHQAETELALKQGQDVLVTVTDDIVIKAFLERGGELTEKDRVFLKKLIDQNELVSRGLPDSSELFELKCKGSHVVSSLWLILGNPEAASTELHECLVFCETHIKLQPTDPVCRLALARTHLLFGLLYLRVTSEPAKAIVHFKKADSKLQELVTAFPALEVPRVTLAYNFREFAAALKIQGSYKEARKHLENGISLFKRLSVDYPTVPEFRNSLALCYLGMGGLLWESGDSKAMEQMRKGLAMLDQLVVEYPDQPYFRGDLAEARYWIGCLCLTGQAWEAASEHFEAALFDFEYAVKVYPRVPENRKRLAAGHAMVALVMAIRGQKNKAQEHNKIAKDIVDKLSTDFPNYRSIEDTLGAYYVVTAVLQVSDNQLDAALLTINKAVEYLGPVASRQPGIAKNVLASALIIRVAILFALDRDDDALVDLAKALDIGLGPAQQQFLSKLNEAIEKSIQEGELQARAGHHIAVAKQVEAVTKIPG
ncbi:MAG TPA: protein kinase, partial [Gemmataceae bacterium]|nr:protein kinase [Gemmataceae bacterium]